MNCNDCIHLGFDKNKPWCLHRNRKPLFNAICSEFEKRKEERDETMNQTEKPKYFCSGTVKNGDDEITISCKGDNLEELLENIKDKLMWWFK